MLRTSSSEKHVSLFCAFLSLPVWSKVLAPKWLRFPSALTLGGLGRWARGGPSWTCSNPSGSLHDPVPGAHGGQAGLRGGRAGPQGEGGRGGLDHWHPHYHILRYRTLCWGQGSRTSSGCCQRRTPVLCRPAGPRGLSRQGPPAAAPLSGEACLPRGSELAAECGRVASPKPDCFSSPLSAHPLLSPFSQKEASAEKAVSR